MHEETNLFERTNLKMLIIILIVFSFGVITTRCQTYYNGNKLADYFGACTKSDSNFDFCVKELLNSVRPLFKSGSPEYGIPPFDPVFVKQVVQKRKWANFDYELILSDVYESGWTKSLVTDFESNFRQNSIQYTQYFPDKSLKGDYKINGYVFGQKISNNGTWNLNLFNYTQVTAITRKPRQASNGTSIYDTPIKVGVTVQTCQKLILHIANLLKGRKILEKFLEIIINDVWQPGFLVLRPLINDIVGTAFTELFNNAFNKFNFNQIIID